jgi:hypothetical protein
MKCDHSGTHSGASRYLRETDQLRLVLLCDRCGAERQELGRLDYRPEIRGSGHPVPGIAAGTRAFAGAGAPLLR